MSNESVKEHTENHKRLISNSFKQINDKIINIKQELNLLDNNNNTNATKNFPLVNNTVISQTNQTNKNNLNNKSNIADSQYKSLLSLNKRHSNIESLKNFKKIKDPILLSPKRNIIEMMSQKEYETALFKEESNIQNSINNFLQSHKQLDNDEKKVKMTNDYRRKSTQAALFANNSSSNNNSNIKNNLVNRYIPSTITVTSQVNLGKTSAINHSNKLLPFTKLKNKIKSTIANKISTKKKHDSDNAINNSKLFIGAKNRDVSPGINKENKMSFDYHRKMSVFNIYHRTNNIINSSSKLYSLENKDDNNLNIMSNINRKDNNMNSETKSIVQNNNKVIKLIKRMSIITTKNNLANNLLNNNNNNNIISNKTNYSRYSSINKNKTLKSKNIKDCTNDNLEDNNKKDLLYKKKTYDNPRINTQVKRNKSINQTLKPNNNKIEEKNIKSIHTHNSDDSSDSSPFKLIEFKLLDNILPEASHSSKLKDFFINLNKSQYNINNAYNNYYNISNINNINNMSFDKPFNTIDNPSNNNYYSNVHTKANIKRKNTNIENLRSKSPDTSVKISKINTLTGSKSNHKYDERNKSNDNKTKAFDNISIYSNKDLVKIGSLKKKNKNNEWSNNKIDNKKIRSNSNIYDQTFFKNNLNLIANINDASNSLAKTNNSNSKKSKNKNSVSSNELDFSSAIRKNKNNKNLKLPIQSQTNNLRNSSKSKNSKSKMKKDASSLNDEIINNNNALISNRKKPELKNSYKARSTKRKISETITMLKNKLHKDVNHLSNFNSPDRILDINDFLSKAKISDGKNVVRSIANINNNNKESRKSILNNNPNNVQSVHTNTNNNICVTNFSANSRKPLHTSTTHLKKKEKTEMLISPLKLHKSKSIQTIDDAVNKKHLEILRRDKNAGNKTTKPHYKDIRKDSNILNTVKKDQLQHRPKHSTNLNNNINKNNSNNDVNDINNSEFPYIIKISPTKSNKSSYRNNEPSNNISNNITKFNPSILKINSTLNNTNQRFSTGNMSNSRSNKSKKSKNKIRNNNQKHNTNLLFIKDQKTNNLLSLDYQQYHPNNNKSFNPLDTRRISNLDINNNKEYEAINNNVFNMSNSNLSNISNNKKDYFKGLKNKMFDRNKCKLNTTSKESNTYIINSLPQFGILYNKKNKNSRNKKLMNLNIPYMGGNITNMQGGYKSNLNSGNKNLINMNNNFNSLSSYNNDFVRSNSYSNNNKNSKLSNSKNEKINSSLEKSPFLQSKTVFGFNNKNSISNTSKENSNNMQNPGTNYKTFLDRNNSNSMTIFNNFRSLSSYSNITNLKPKVISSTSNNYININIPSVNNNTIQMNNNSSNNKQSNSGLNMKSFIYNTPRFLERKKLVYDSFSDDEEIENETENTTLLFGIDTQSSFKIFFDLSVFILIIISVSYCFFGFIIYDFSCKDDILEFLLFNLIFDIYFIIDFLLGFFWSFYNANEEKVFNIIAISKNYLKGFFIVNFLTSIPLTSFFIVLQYLLYCDLNYNTPNHKSISQLNKFNNKNSMNENYSRNIAYPYYTDDYYRITLYNKNYLHNEGIVLAILLIRICKLLKIYDPSFVIERLSSEIADSMDFSLGSRRLIKYFFCFLVLIHVLACYWIWLASTNQGKNWLIDSELNEASIFQIYIASLYFIITTISTIGYGDIIGQNYTEQGFQIFLMGLAMTIYTFIISNISNIVKASEDENTEQDKLIDFLNNAKIQYEMNERLYLKAYKFLEFKFRNSKYNKSILLKDLPSSVQNEVTCTVYESLIRMFKFFKPIKFFSDNEELFIIQPEFAVAVLTKINPIKFQRNDYLIHENESIEELIMIKSGILAIEFTYDKGKYKIIELYKGEHFGEVQMILNQKSRFAVRVRSRVAELYLLSKFDLLQISKEFQIIFKEIYKESAYNMLILESLRSTLKFELEHDMWKKAPENNAIQNLSNHSINNSNSRSIYLSNDSKGNTNSSYRDNIHNTIKNDNKMSFNNNFDFSYNNENELQGNNDSNNTDNLSITSLNLDDLNTNSYLTTPNNKNFNDSKINRKPESVVDKDQKNEAFTDNLKNIKINTDSNNIVINKQDNFLSINSNLDSINTDQKPSIHQYNNFNNITIKNIFQNYDRKSFNSINDQSFSYYNKNKLAIPIQENYQQYFNIRKFTNPGKIENNYDAYNHNNNNYYNIPVSKLKKLNKKNNGNTNNNSNIPTNNIVNPISSVKKQNSIKQLLDNYKLKNKNNKSKRKKESVQAVFKALNINKITTNKHIKIKINDKENNDNSNNNTKPSILNNKNVIRNDKKKISFKVDAQKNSTNSNYVHSLNNNFNLNVLQKHSSINNKSSIKFHKKYFLEFENQDTKEVYLNSNNSNNNPISNIDTETENVNVDINNINTNTNNTELLLTNNSSKSIVKANRRVNNISNTHSNPIRNKSFCNSKSMISFLNKSSNKAVYSKHSSLSLAKPKNKTKESYLINSIYSNFMKTNSKKKFNLKNKTSISVRVNKSNNSAKTFTDHKITSPNKTMISNNENKTFISTRLQKSLSKQYKKEQPLISLLNNNISNKYYEEMLNKSYHSSSKSYLASESNNDSKTSLLQFASSEEVVADNELTVSKHDKSSYSDSSLSSFENNKSVAPIPILNVISENEDEYNNEEVSFIRLSRLKSSRFNLYNNLSNNNSRSNVNMNNNTALKKIYRKMNNSIYSIYSNTKRSKSLKDSNAISSNALAENANNAFSTKTFNNGMSQLNKKKGTNRLEYKNSVSLVIKSNTDNKINNDPGYNIDNSYTNNESISEITCVRRSKISKNIYNKFSNSNIFQSTCKNNTFSTNNLGSLSKSQNTSISNSNQLSLINNNTNALKTLYNTNNTISTNNQGKKRNSNRVQKIYTNTSLLNSNNSNKISNLNTVKQINLSSLEINDSNSIRNKNNNSLNKDNVSMRIFPISNMKNLNNTFNENTKTNIPFSNSNLKDKSKSHSNNTANIVNQDKLNSQNHLNYSNANVFNFSANNSSLSNKQLSATVSHASHKESRFKNANCSSNNISNNISKQNSQKKNNKKNSIEVKQDKSEIHKFFFDKLSRAEDFSRKQSISNVNNSHNNTMTNYDIVENKNIEYEISRESSDFSDNNDIIKMNNIIKDRSRIHLNNKSSYKNIIYSNTKYHNERIDINNDSPFKKNSFNLLKNISQIKDLPSGLIKQSPLVLNNNSKLNINYTNKSINFKPNISNSKSYTFNSEGKINSNLSTIYNILDTNNKNNINLNDNNTVVNMHLGKSDSYLNKNSNSTNIPKKQYNTNKQINNNDINNNAIDNKSSNNFSSNVLSKISKNSNYYVKSKYNSKLRDSSNEFFSNKSSSDTDSDIIIKGTKENRKLYESEAYPIIVLNKLSNISSTNLLKSNEIKTSISNNNISNTLLVTRNSSIIKKGNRKITGHKKESNIKKELKFATTNKSVKSVKSRKSRKSKRSHRSKSSFKSDLSSNNRNKEKKMNKKSTKSQYFSPSREKTFITLEKDSSYSSGINDSSSEVNNIKQRLLDIRNNNFTSKTNKTNKTIATRKSKNTYKKAKSKKLKTSNFLYKKDMNENELYKAFPISKSNKFEEFYIDLEKLNNSTYESDLSKRSKIRKVNYFREKHKKIEAYKSRKSWKSCHHTSNNNLVNTKNNSNKKLDFLKKQSRKDFLEAEADFDYFNYYNLDMTKRENQGIVNPNYEKFKSNAKFLNLINNYSYSNINKKPSFIKEKNKSEVRQKRRKLTLHVNAIEKEFKEKIMSVTTKEMNICSNNKNNNMTVNLTNNQTNFSNLNNNSFTNSNLLKSFSNNKKSNKYLKINSNNKSQLSSGSEKDKTHDLMNFKLRDLSSLVESNNDIISKINNKKRSMRKKTIRTENSNKLNYNISNISGEINQFHNNTNAYKNSKNNKSIFLSIDSINNNNISNNLNTNVNTTNIANVNNNVETGNLTGFTRRLKKTNSIVPTNNLNINSSKYKLKASKSLSKDTSNNEILDVILKKSNHSFKVNKSKIEYNNKNQTALNTSSKQLKIINKNNSNILSNNINYKQNLLTSPKKKKQNTDLSALFDNRKSYDKFDYKKYLPTSAMELINNYTNIPHSPQTTSNIINKDKKQLFSASRNNKKLSNLDNKTSIINRRSLVNSTNVTNKSTFLNNNNSNSNFDSTLKNKRSSSNLILAETEKNHAIKKANEKLKRLVKPGIKISNTNNNTPLGKSEKSISKMNRLSSQGGISSFSLESPLKIKNLIVRRNAMNKNELIKSINHKEIRKNTEYILNEIDVNIENNNANINNPKAYYETNFSKWLLDSKMEDNVFSNLGNDDNELSTNKSFKNKKNSGRDIFSLEKINEETENELEKKRRKIKKAISKEHREIKENK